MPINGPHPLIEPKATAAQKQAPDETGVNTVTPDAADRAEQPCPGDFRETWFAAPWSASRRRGGKPGSSTEILRRSRRHPGNPMASACSHSPQSSTCRLCRRAPPSGRTKGFGRTAGMLVGRSVVRSAEPVSLALRPSQSRPRRPELRMRTLPTQTPTPASVHETASLD
jgi:hypothetical protein